MKIELLLFLYTTVIMLAADVLADDKTIKKYNRRAAKDINNLIKDGPESHIYVKILTPDADPLDQELRIMMVGPENTPYEDALLFFRMYFEKKANTIYPTGPPRMQFLCPYSFRCHPNLYRLHGGWNPPGKVCLSFLGTWAGPGWAPMMSLETICQQIYGILDDYPLRNEPGWEKGHDQGVADFTEYVRYACMRETIELFYGPVNRGEPVRELYGEEYYGMFQEEIKMELDARRDKMIARFATYHEQTNGKKVNAATPYDRAPKAFHGQHYDYDRLITQITEQ